MRLLLALSATLAASLPAFADDDFEKNVRPLLVEHCIKCHGPEKAKSGLRLDSREAILKGGNTGPSAVSGKPDESYIIKVIEYKDDLRMPPKAKLPDAAIATLRQWVAKGLVWPASVSTPGTTTAIAEAQRKWWAFQPIKVVTPPVSKNQQWVKSAIDHFIAAKLESQMLTLNQPADRRTLLRRATYDLTGLPPTPEEVDAFLNDKSPEAFTKVIDRLLASPHYGERWGRHWLDLVRYADTAGENSDHPVPDAWRYRNWVIDSFNRGQPYDEFIREQIAGDLIGKTGPPEQYASRVVATGFLAIARRFGHDTDTDMHLTHEDTIDVLGKAFLGLSISCARCHDHKYDPITARDYYALSGILQSTRFPFPGCEAKQQPRDMMPLLPPTEWAKVVEPYQKRLATLDAELKQSTDAQAKLLGELKASAAKSQLLLGKGEIADGGKQDFGTSPGKPLDPVDVKIGHSIQLSILPLSNHGADSTHVEWEIAEVGGQQRKWNLTHDVIDDLLAGNPHADHLKNDAVWWFLDGQKLLGEPVRDISGKPGLHAWRNGDTPSVFANSTPQPIAVWTKLPARSLFVHPGPNGPVAVAWVSPIAGKVQITGRIIDAHPGGPDGVGWTIDHFASDQHAGLKRVIELEKQRSVLTEQRIEFVRKAPRQDTAYAVTEGKIANSRIHLRGDPEKLGVEVPRRWLEVLGGQQVTQLESGRLQLAQWLTDSKNPLTARVMVNRIWQHHFGKGLVQTPNDFGTRGMKPTHPELLDWLATEFVESGWSVKAMHRKILLSAVYQQASTGRAEALERDPNNETYWRFDRQRLSAEELRDSLLALSGQLDRTPGGPHPFPPTSAWGFTQHNPFSANYETNKRSVYLMTLRNRRHPFLGLFDGADPNASTPNRQVTTVPTQSLYFFNDSFFHAQCEGVATLVLRKTEDTVRVDELFRLALQRIPTPQDRTRSLMFLQTYTVSLKDIPPADQPKVAWSALVRILLASNEFLYLD